jgi:hypothetical protein
MLIYLLLGDNDETKAAASHALAIMAESNFCQDAIRNNGFSFYIFLFLIV